VRFDTFDSQFDVVPSSIIAEECPTIGATPLLSMFLRELRTGSET